MSKKRIFLVVAMFVFISACKKDPKNITVEVQMVDAGTKYVFMDKKNNEIANELWTPKMQLISRSGEKLPDGDISGTFPSGNSDAILSYAGGKLQNIKIMKNNIISFEVELKDDSTHLVKAYANKEGIKIIQEYKNGQVIYPAKWFKVDNDIPMGVFTLSESNRLMRNTGAYESVLSSSCKKGVMLNCAALGKRFLDRGMNKTDISTLHIAGLLLTSSCLKGEMLGCFYRGMMDIMISHNNGDQQLENEGKTLVKRACDNGANYACKKIDGTYEP